jgi:hypothetical protein
MAKHYNTGTEWFVGEAWYGIDPQRFDSALIALAQSLPLSGLFLGDNLITWGKELSFLKDERFVDAFTRNVDGAQEASLMWRTALLIWAGKRAMRREGDFVEAGTYRGTTARIICDYFDFGSSGRRYFLYDLFDQPWRPGERTMDRIGPALHPHVVERFRDLPNVTIIKGRLPETLAIDSPSRIALLHIDLNNAPSEQAVMEALYDRVADGAAIVLDDYGWTAHHEQRLVADRFFAARGTEVMELPTGQGLVIK